MTRDPMPPDATLTGVGLDVRRRRILFRATHRGTKEADLLVGGFVARHVAGMDNAALDAIEAVLELPDTDLADWLTGRRTIPEEMQTDMLRAMLAAAPMLAAPR
jgi:antitoxin CptB